MITSYMPGRVRIRHKALKKEDNLKNALDTLRTHDGITKIGENIHTGSILIEYAPSLLPCDTLTSAIALLQKSLDKKEGVESVTPSISFVNENTLLYATYLGTMVSLFASRRLHVLFGSAFAALSLLHMVRKRKRAMARKQK